MSLSVTVTPGYMFGPTEEVTNTKLNLAATPTVNLAGAAGSSAIADGAVTTAKVADQAVTTAKLADANVTAAKLASDALIATQMAPAGTAKNLSITVAAGAGATHQVVISADAIVLANASALKYQATTVSVTADMASAGANGLDTGAEASNTWYYLWVIYDPIGNTVASLLSTATVLSGVTLPGNYSYGALVGVVRNDGASNFTAFNQQGREVWYQVEKYIFKSTAGQNGLGALSGAALTAWGTFVPTAIAKVVYGDFGIESSGIALRGMLTTSSTNQAGRCLLSCGSSSTLYDSMYASCAFRLPLLAGTTPFWDTGTGSNNYRMMVTGYVLGINAV